MRALAVICLIPTLVAASDLTQLVPARQRVQDPLLVLVDVSGSMTGMAGRAQQEVRRILASTDAGRVGVIAWAAGHARLLAGAAGERRWIRIPDGNAADVVCAWLSTVSVGSQATRLAPAIRAAMADPEARSVVIVSDGLLDDPVDALAALREGQAARAKAGHRPLVVGVLLTPTQGDVATIGTGSVVRHIAQIGGGGLWSTR